MVTEEELNFDLESLKALQKKHEDTISRLSDVIRMEQSTYDAREKIINVLSEEEEPTDQVRHDLHTLYNEQIKRLDNIKMIREAIAEEERQMYHEHDIIRELERRQNGDN